MFTLNRNTSFVTQLKEAPVLQAIAMLERDRNKVFVETQKPGGSITLVRKNMRKQCSEEKRERILSEERYKISVTSDKIVIYAQGELGFVYGLLYLSEHYMGIHPFWFWMDQKIELKKKVGIPEGVICSEDPKIVFRGWCFDDEVLLLKWNYNKNGMDGWKMCFEALLRCGGNLAIAGIERESRKNGILAEEYGLWITHHHTKPLGSERFSRVYPTKKQNYAQYPELFYNLWENAVQEQKDDKIVWNLGFYEQEDFLLDQDKIADSMQEYGEKFSALIELQYHLVKQYVEQPVLCMELYGTVLELYQQGLIRLPEDVIKVYPDNGFGKMVYKTKKNPERRSAMPDAKDKSAQGICYHVSYCDLRAGNHITMLPNSVDFVNHELNEVQENRGDFFWMVHCSNVRPHTYFLDMIRKKWFGENVTGETHAEEFVNTYFTEYEEAKEEIEALYYEYSKAMLAFGPNEDEYAGEQFYTETVRLLCHQLMTDRSSPAKELCWLTGESSLTNQIREFGEICKHNRDELEKLCLACTVTENALQHKALFSATIGLQIKLHQTCRRGARCFVKGYDALLEQDYEKAFLLFGDSVVWFKKGEALLHGAEYGVWKEFYLNDCITDIKHTAYVVKKVMGLVRELGDNARHDAWYRKYCYFPGDIDAYLLPIQNNHLTDEELYEAMKKRVVR